MRIGGAQLDVSLLEDWPSENGCFIQNPVNTSRVKDCVPLLIFRNGCSTCSMTRSPDGGRIDTMADESVPLTRETSRRRQFLRLPVSLPVLGRAPQFPGEALRGMVLNVSGGGMLAEFPVELVPGSAVDFVIQTRHGQLEVEGEVIWTSIAEGRIRHGVAFPEPRGQAFAVDLFLGENR
jgi:hypothetical protein